MTLPGCPGILGPVCQAVGSAGSTVLGAGAGDILNYLADWVATGASWLLDQTGAVLSSSTSINLGAGWFTSQYHVMGGIAAAVTLPLLLLSAAQAVYRQAPGLLARSALVQLPLALLLTAVAVTLVQMSLAVTDALCATVSAGTGTDVQNVLGRLATALVTQVAANTQGAPTFVLFVGGLLLALGALVLWFELLVRTAAVYVAVLFLPLGLASLVWPAISHWARRLVDTLVALVLSKFVIVTVLALSVAALDSGTQSGFSTVLAGAALLLLAVFCPFTLFRLVPAIEAGAVHQFEGTRRRLVPLTGSIPHNAAAFALRQLRQAGDAPGAPGTGSAVTFDPPGPDDGGMAAGGGPGAGAGRAGDGPGAGGPADAGPGEIPMWRGVPPPGEGVDGRQASSVAFGTGGIIPGRGPLPLWGGPPGPAGEGGQGTGENPGGDGRTLIGTRASLVLDRDHMGPTIRWAPQAGAAATVPDAVDPGAALGAQAAGGRSGDSVGR